MSDVLDHLRLLDGTHLMGEDHEAIAVSDIIVAFATVQGENTRLRAALAASELACVYCQLPAEEMAKCKSGFPGCARADDMTGCPEFGATEVLFAAEEIVRETIEGHKPDASFDDSMHGAVERKALLHNVANETIAALRARALIASGRTEEERR